MRYTINPREYSNFVLFIRFRSVPIVQARMTGIDEKHSRANVVDAMLLYNESILNRDYRLTGWILRPCENYKYVPPAVTCALMKITSRFVSASYS